MSIQHIVLDNSLVSLWNGVVKPLVILSHVFWRVVDYHGLGACRVNLNVLGWVLQVDVDALTLFNCQVGQLRVHSH